MAEVIGAIDVPCTLGESPVWDDRLACLWWTDITEQLLYCWSPRTHEASHFRLPERLTSLGLTADSAWLICAFASGFALFQPATGTVDWLHRTEPHYRGIRMNDGRVDAQGNFWAGSMVEDVGLARDSKGTLYRLAPNRTVTGHLEGITISNAISFPPAGDFIYFADTPTGRIEKLCLSGGGLVYKRTPFAAPSGGGRPDGAIVDDDGCLWNAEWGGARVTTYSPNGSVVGRMPLPVSQPTSAVFGGATLELLFVTSAREGLDDARLALEPDAGKVLICRTDARGSPPPKFPFCQCEAQVNEFGTHN